MILINTASRIRAAISDPILDTQINESIAAIRRYFMHPEFKALLEMVGPDGELIDTCNGRVINPGHCIETAWFILEEAKHRHWDKDLVQMGTGFSNGLGNGDGIRNMAVSSTSAIAVISPYKTILKI